MEENDERTVQDLIEQGGALEGMEKKGKESLFKEVGEKMEKEDEKIASKKRFKEAGGWKEAGRRTLHKFTKPFTTKLPPEKSRIYEEKGNIIHKIAHLAAPKGSIIERITTSKKSGKVGGKQRVKSGRGRPTGSFKVRVLPYSGKRVKVPTAIYKKMLSAEKSQYRLAQSQLQAERQIQADQLAMQQDPRYRPGAEEQFLAEPDMQHEEALQRAQEQAQMAQFEPQRPSTMQKVSGALQSLGRGVSRIGGSMGVRRPMQMDQYGRQVQPQGLTLFGGSGMLGGQGGGVIGPVKSEPRIGQLVREPRVGGLLREPQVTAISSKANLLKRRLR